MPYSSTGFEMVLSFSLGNIQLTGLIKLDQIIVFSKAQMVIGKFHLNGLGFSDCEITIKLYHLFNHNKIIKCIYAT